MEYINASNILEVYFQSIFELYFKYTSSIVEPIELYFKNYTSSLYYFDRKSTFEARFVKLNHHLNLDLKHSFGVLSSIILYVYFKCTSEVYFKYTLQKIQAHF